MSQLNVAEKDRNTASLTQHTLKPAASAALAGLLRWPPLLLPPQPFTDGEPTHRLATAEDCNRRDSTSRKRLESHRPRCKLLTWKQTKSRCVAQVLHGLLVRRVLSTRSGRRQVDRKIWKNWFSIKYFYQRWDSTPVPGQRNKGLEKQVQRLRG